jgi:hypothetical protein
MALHCPATIHLLGLEALPGALDVLAQEHIAVVCVGEVATWRGTAESAATSLGVPLRVVPDLGVDGPRHDALLDLADQYRGEHVLVLVSGHHQLVTMEVGDDGIRLLARPGEAAPG